MPSTQLSNPALNHWVSCLPPANGVLAVRTLSSPQRVKPAPNELCLETSSDPGKICTHPQGSITSVTLTDRRMCSELQLQWPIGSPGPCTVRLQPLTEPLPGLRKPRSVGPRLCVPWEKTGLAWELDPLHSKMTADPRSKPRRAAPGLGVFPPTPASRLTASPKPAKGSILPPWLQGQVDLVVNPGTCSFAYRFVLF